MLNKNILVVGGAGYLGSAILRQLSRKSAIYLASVQRHNPSTDKAVLGVDYVQANVFDTDKYKEKVKDADVVIHSMGVLIDSTITKGAKQGDDGTYEKVNYESAKVVADLANSFDDKKRKFIYISANMHLPFIPRYLDTKFKAEEYARELSNLIALAVRPGLIIDSKERPITMPLGQLVNFGNCVNNTSLFQSLKRIKYLGDFMQNFEVGKSIEREDLSKAIAFLALSNDIDQLRIFKHNEIMEASKRYNQLLNE